jgi:hypothetical protein
LQHSGIGIFNGSAFSGRRRVTKIAVKGFSRNILKENGTMLLLAAVLAWGGARSALAEEFDFGAVGAHPFDAAVGHVVTDPGVVAINDMSFIGLGNPVFTATGFNTPFAAGGGGAVTLRVDGPTNYQTLFGLPIFPFEQSGIGENLAPPAAACSDPNCEMAPGTGVAVVASGTLLDDAIIGAVDPGDSFNFFTGSSVANLAFAGTFTGGSADCTPAPGTTATCLITFPAAAAIGVQSDNASVLISAVSFPALPEPASAAMLCAGLLGIGLARRRRRK